MRQRIRRLSFANLGPASIRLSLLLPIILVLTLATGCGSNELTRSRAAELIEGSQEFTKPLAINLKAEGKYSVLTNGSDDMESQLASAHSYFFRDNLELAALQQLGLADFKAVKLTSPGSVGNSCIVAATLTDTGRAAARQWQQTRDGWTIPLAARELIEVTGVAGGQGDAKSARVEYTWKWAPTEIGTNFDVSQPAYQDLISELKATYEGGAAPDRRLGARFDGSKTHKAVAVFERYDDGWRLVASGPA